MSARRSADKKGISANGAGVPEQAPVKVWGSYIWPEMRLICNIFDTVSRPYRVESAGDIFTAVGQKDEAAFNPARVQPIVVINDTKILADPVTLVKHVCRNFSLEQMYPLASKSQEARQKIDMILEVVFLHFKRTTDRLVKIYIQKKAVVAGKIAMSDLQRQQLDEAFEYERTSVFGSVLRTVNTWLEETETSYLCTEKVSAADLAVYQQLKQAFAFGAAPIDANEFERLAEWFGWLDADWNSGKLKGREQLEDIYDKLSQS